MPKPLTNPFQLLRGMKDILPADQPYWLWIFDVVRQAARDYGFERIETPVLEPTNLFVRGVGEATDIVQKEMYAFVDKNGDNISLRPEYTAGVARAYIEHGMLNLPQPVKLWYFGPVFRHDRPQAGRYRQFWHFGFEVLGGDQPVLDAQLILLQRAICNTLGLETTIQVNSIGDPADRAQYLKALQGFFKTKKSILSDEQKLLLQKNPFRLLDSKDPAWQEVLNDVPQIVDYLADGPRQHFVQVLEYLDELEISYVLNPRLVRGLDYYNRTVWEFWTANDSQGQMSLGGGGRYDGLVELLGGRPTPAVGYAGGIERLILAMKERNVVTPVERPEIYLAQLGEPARKKVFKLFEELRAAGIRVAESLTKDGIKQQLEIANRLGVQYTLIIGHKEMMDGTILIRDMENGIQEIVDFKKTASEIKKRLEKTKANGVTPVAGAVKPERFEPLPPVDEEPTDQAPQGGSDDSA
ncbi:MAG: histidine--tRNA ligase [Candidatus Kerfeldbacteria bacterium]|nr:histidine--tRNA ligase [Candidatus Kerfeldbacteria bacterium]